MSVDKNQGIDHWVIAWAPAIVHPAYQAKVNKISHYKRNNDLCDAVSDYLWDRGYHRLRYLSEETYGVL